MYPVGKPVDEESSILVDFVRSGHDESHVGTVSEPYLITADHKSVEQVAYACGAAHPWRVGSGALREPIEAPHAYLFYLLNNTRTYRVYEQSVIAELPEGRAQLHAGDDFIYHHPIRSGDTLAVTAEILPIRRKSGRHGDLTFFSDAWKMYNQHNQLAAVLVRRAVAIDFSKSHELQAPDGERSDLPANTADGAPWVHSRSVATAFEPGAITHVTQHGPMSWMSMMGWLAAVDEYSPTHFDPDFASAHRYGNGRSIVAGPQLASLMVSALEGSLGPGWWIASYENVQRRPVYPKEVLASYSRVRSVDRDRATLDLYLIDDAGVVKGTGTAQVAAIHNERTIHP